jgi:hypothetical protein
MADTAKPNVFDEAEREQIRGALKRYKAANRIGDPGLQQNMLAAFSMAPDFVKKVESGFVPLKTLQRFLKGAHRTEDAMILRYRKFLELVRTPPPYEIMGEAIVVFYANAPTGEDRSAFNETVARSFARIYRCYTRGERRYLEGAGSLDYPDFPIPADDPYAPPFHIPYSLLQVEPLAGTPFLKVSERVVNPNRDDLITEIETQPGAGGTLYEGVLAITDTPQVYVITLRAVDTFTFYPRFYLLYGVDHRNAAASVLEGSCVTVSEDVSARQLCEAFEVKLYPAPG